MKRGAPLELQSLKSTLCNENDEQRTSDGGEQCGGVRGGDAGGQGGAVAAGELPAPETSDETEPEGPPDGDDVSLPGRLTVAGSVAADD